MIRQKYQEEKRMVQLAFELPEINREETKKVVETALEKYRMYLLTIPETRIPKITATYSLVSPLFHLHLQIHFIQLQKMPLFMQ